MKSGLVFAAAVGCVAGLFCGQWLWNSISFRKMLAQKLGRGNLAALVHGSGIYEQDIAEESSPEMGKEQLFAEAQVGFDARQENVSRAEIDREYRLFQFQLPDGNRWAVALKENRLCPWMLRSRIVRNLRSSQWIERRIAAQSRVSIEECRTYFQDHQKDFFQPERFRVSHLFLAAPEGTSEEVANVKRRTTEELLGRLDRGEKLADLTPEFSEDDATRNTGGDLGYFSDSRMPEDFVAAVHQLQPGRTSRVTRTVLGFHILQLIETRPAREMTFDEARPEIELRLANARRHEELGKLVAEASSKAGFTR